MNTTKMYHKCNILRERPQAIFNETCLGCLEDNGKSYTALLQYVLKMRHECIIDKSWMHCLTFNA